MELHPRGLEQLHENWGDQSGFACAFTKSGGHRFFHWPEEADALWRFLTDISAPESVYVGFSLFDSARRSNQAATIVPGVLLDVDIASGQHAKSELPRTAQEALTVLAEAQLPSPTRVIQSGGGLYVQLLFDRPFVIADDVSRARVARVLKGVTSIAIEAFGRAGLHLDDVSDLARITRVPGQLNRKYDPPREVVVMTEDGPRYSVETLEALIGSGLTIEHSRTATPVDSRQFADEADARADFALVEQYCGFVRQMRDNPTGVSEPEWYAAATIATHCEGGAERFHALSALDAARYDKGETDRKLAHARTARPRTCASIEKLIGHRGCGRCPFKAASFNSPIALAFGEPELLKLQSEYVFDGVTESYVCHTRPEPVWSRRGFGDNHAHKVPRTTERFVHDRRSPKVNTTDYIPGESALIVQQSSGKSLNRWKSDGVAAAQGDAGLILEHLAYLLPRDNEKEWLLDYLAHLLKHPAVKIAHAIMLIGKQGVGKSFVNSLLQKLFGVSNVFVDDAQIHAGKYRRALGNKQVVVIEEMKLTDKWEVANEIKPWLTADFVMAEEKYVASNEVRTPRGVFIHSNHAIPVVLEPGDRRFAIFRSDADPREGAYYKRLFNEGLDQAGAFKRLLLARDIGAWSASAAPPMTQAKVDTIEGSRTPVAMDIAELIEGKEIPDLVTKDEIAAKLSGSRQLAPTNSQITKALHELGCRKLPKTKLDRTATATLWAVRNVEHWAAVDHAGRREAYDAMRSNLAVVRLDVPLAIQQAIDGARSKPLIH